MKDRGILVVLKIGHLFFCLSENRSLFFEIKRISEISEIGVYGIYANYQKFLNVELSESSVSIGDSHLRTRHYFKARSRY